MAGLELPTTLPTSNSDRPQAINESIIRNIETDLKNAIQVFESEKLRLNARIDDLTADNQQKDQEIKNLKLSTTVEIEILENERKQLQESQKLISAENPKELRCQIQNLEIENKRLQVDQNHKDLVIERLEQTLQKEIAEIKHRENNKVQILEQEIKKQAQDYAALESAYKELEHLKALQLDQNHKDLVIQRLEQALEKEITQNKTQSDAKLSNLEAQLKTSKDDYTDLNKSFRELEQKYILVTKTEVPKIESKISQMQAENEAFQSKLIEKERDIMRMTREIAEEKSEKKENKQVEGRISALERSISINQPDIGDFQKQLQETALRLQGLEDQLCQASATRTQIKTSKRETKRPLSRSASKTTTRIRWATPQTITPRKKGHSRRISRTRHNQSAILRSSSAKKIPKKRKN